MSVAASGDIHSGLVLSAAADTSEAGISDADLNIWLGLCC